MENNVQLITYPDSLGGNLKSLNKLLDNELKGLFGGIHILPPFPSSGDRGFSPITYDEIEPSFGEWQDIEGISQKVPVMLDMMVNHISRKSKEFKDYERKGGKSAYHDLFLENDWPEADLEKVFLRRKKPYSEYSICGQNKRLWTTFGKSEPSEQIDLNITRESTKMLLERNLAAFAKHGVKKVRLDAIGYCIKKRGTDCFMVEPEIFDFLDWLSETAKKHGLEILPEIHAAPIVRQKLIKHGYQAYDFALPLLVLHTLLSKNGRQLKKYLQKAERNQVTTLDCHDGIPVLPDCKGLLSRDEMQMVVDVCKERGGNISKLLKPEDGIEAHQINITYRSAIGSDGAYLCSRVIQLFSPGIPQIYYVGLLAGENDEVAVGGQDDGRAINRHNYSNEGIKHGLSKDVTQKLLELIRLRNTHPAFDGDFQVIDSPDNLLILEWRKGNVSCKLDLNLETYEFEIDQ